MRLVILLGMATFICVSQAADALGTHRFSRRDERPGSPPAYPRSADQGEVLLQSRFEKDQPIYVKWAMRSEQKLAVNEMIVRQDQTGTYVMRLVPETRDAAGNWVVE